MVHKSKNIIKIYPGVPFKISARLGPTLFKAIVRLKGLDYKRGEGFVVNDLSIIPRINAILKPLNVLLVPYGNCIICNKDIQCENCEYLDNCKKDIDMCICRRCLDNPLIWENYIRSQKAFYG